MNFSLSSLNFGALAFGNSPLIHVPYRAEKISVSLNQIKYWRNFNPFFHSGSRLTFSISHSEFSNVLDCSISITSTSFVYITNQTKDITSISVSISTTVFRNCSNYDHSGGAFLVNNSAATVSVFECSFFYCFAAGGSVFGERDNAGGGAFCANALTIDVNSVCCIRCSTMVSRADGIYLRAANSASLTNSLFFLIDINYGINGCAFITDKAAILYKNINCSANNEYDGPGPNTGSMLLPSLETCQLISTANCSGSPISYFQSSSNSNIHSSCNFINCSSSSSQLVTCTGTHIFQQFCFIKNSQSGVTVTGQATLISCCGDNLTIDSYATISGAFAKTSACQTFHLIKSCPNEWSLAFTLCTNFSPRILSTLILIAFFAE